MFETILNGSASLYVRKYFTNSLVIGKNIWIFFHITTNEIIEVINVTIEK